LGGAPGAAEDALRFRLRLDQREHAFGDRLLAERLECLCVSAGFGVFCDLAQDELAEGGQVLVAEEVLEREEPLALFESAQLLTVSARKPAGGWRTDKQNCLFSGRPEERERRDSNPRPPA